MEIESGQEVVSPTDCRRREGRVKEGVADDLTPEQVRAFMLPIELSQFSDVGFDLGLLGFDEEELARLLDPGVKEGRTRERTADLCADPKLRKRCLDESTTRARLLHCRVAEEGKTEFPVGLHEPERVLASASLR